MRGRIRDGLRLLHHSARTIGGRWFFLAPLLPLIWIGWQFDVPTGRSGLRLRVPQVRAADGTTIEGPVRCDWTVDRVLDMCRTATNVGSDSSIALVIAHTENELDPTALES